MFVRQHTHKKSLSITHGRTCFAHKSPTPDFTFTGESIYDFSPKNAAVNKEFMTQGDVLTRGSSLLCFWTTVLQDFSHRWASARQAAPCNNEQCWNLSQRHARIWNDTWRSWENFENAKADRSFVTLASGCFHYRKVVESGFLNWLKCWFQNSKWPKWNKVNSENYIPWLKINKHAQLRTLFIYDKEGSTVRVCRLYRLRSRFLVTHVWRVWPSKNKPLSDS